MSRADPTCDSVMLEIGAERTVPSAANSQAGICECRRDILRLPRLYQPQPLKGPGGTQSAPQTHQSIANETKERLRLEAGEGYLQSQP